MNIWLSMLLMALEMIIKWLENKDKVSLGHKVRLNHALARMEVFTQKAKACGCHAQENISIKEESVDDLVGKGINWN